MSKTVDIENRELISAEARAWLAQIETGELSAEDRKAFRTWINTSPVHLEEFRLFSDLSAQLNDLHSLIEPLEAREKPKHQYVPRFVAVAATIMLLLFGTVIMFQSYTVSPDTVTAYTTEIGEYRSITLEDGSVIQLNTGSSVNVTFTDQTREVLLDKGEAFFTVAKDPSRPFTVFAGENAIRAIGTAFSVRLVDSKNTSLIVTEGIVEFSNTLKTVPDNAISSETPEMPVEPDLPVRVAAGHGYSTTAALHKEPVQVLDETVRQSKIAWTEGIFDFSGTPLMDVIGEVSRHTELNIIVDDPQVENIMFGGIFPLGDIDALLETLPHFGVDVKYVGSKEIHISLAENIE